MKTRSVRGRSDEVWLHQLASERRDRYALGMRCRGCTLRQIGEALGVSAERARRILCRASGW